MAKSTNQFLYPLYTMRSTHWELHDIGNLYDGLDTTGWKVLAVLPAWIAYDLGAGYSQAITEIKLYVSATIKDYIIEGSNNATDWDNLTSGTLGSSNYFTTGVSITFANTTNYRYYRLYITSTYDGTYSVYLNRWEGFFDTNTTTTTTTTAPPTTTTTTTTTLAPNHSLWDTSEDPNILAYPSGMRLRKEDINGDFSFYSPHWDFNYDDAGVIEGTASVSDNVPPGTEFRHSRKNVRPNPGSEVEQQFFGPGVLEFNSKGVQAKLTELNIWLRAPYHDIFHTSQAYYVYQAYVFESLYGRDQTPVGGYYLPVTGLAEDCHDPHSPGQPLVYCATGEPAKWHYAANNIPLNNVWRKYTFVFDWVNQNLVFKINDASAMNEMRLSNIHPYVAVDALGFTSSLNSIWKEGYYGVYTGTERKYISKWREYADYNISYADTIMFTDRPFTYWTVTDFCRLFLHTGYSIQTHVFTAASENINRVYLSWDESVYEDTTISMEYGRSLPHDDSSGATASGSASGHAPSAALDQNDSTYWQANSSTCWWQYQFASAKTISKVGLYLGSGSAAYTITGSNDGSTWSSALASGTYTPVCTGSGMEIIIASPASYLYYRISFTAAVTLYNCQMREAVSEHNTSAAASILVESRVSTDGGANWSAWSTATSGANIAGISAGSNKSTLQVQTRHTLSTENPRFQPILESMTLAVYGVSSDETPNVTLYVDSPATTTTTTTIPPVTTTTTTMEPLTTTTTTTTTTAAPTTTTTTAAPTTTTTTAAPTTTTTTTTSGGITPSAARTLSVT